MVVEKEIEKVEVMGATRRREVKNKEDNTGTSEPPPPQVLAGTPPCNWIQLSNWHHTTWLEFPQEEAIGHGSKENCR